MYILLQKNVLILYTFIDCSVNMVLFITCDTPMGFVIMWTFKFLFVLVIFILAGCVQMPLNSDSRISNLAVTSVWDEPTKFSAGSTYSLSPQHLDNASSKTGDIKKAYLRYAEGIKQNFSYYGYQEVPNADAAEFHVRFILALSDDLDDKTISEKFGITPGLQESQGLNKGSILIAVIDANTGQRVWHGAIQGFVQEEATELERDKRRTYVINMVLAQFHKSH